LGVNWSSAIEKVEAVMLVILGLLILLAAVIAAVTGVLANSGPTHPLAEDFSVFGYHVTGSTGTLFLFGIAIGAVAMLGMSVLLAGARRTAGRGQAARRELARAERETTFLNRDRAALLETQDASIHEASRSMRTPLMSRWLKGRQSTAKR
jgi:uncharacterized membrane protein